MILSYEFGGIIIGKNHLLVLKIRIQKAATWQIVVCHNVVEVEHTQMVTSLLQQRDDNIQKIRTYYIIITQEKDKLGIGMLYAKEEIVHPTYVLFLLIELK